MNSIILQMIPIYDMILKKLAKPAGIENMPFIQLIKETDTWGETHEYTEIVELYKKSD